MRCCGRTVVGMEMMIGCSLMPLNFSRNDGTRVRRRYDNSRGNVQNVHGESLANSQQPEIMNRKSDAECREFRAFPDRTGSSSIVSTATSPCMSTFGATASQQAKFWLVPVELAWNDRFSPRELNEIRRLVVEHKVAIIEAWHEHCGRR